MPLPTPHKHESSKKFISRCMSDNVMTNEYPDNKQRYAICNSQLEKGSKSIFQKFVEALLSSKKK